MVLERFVPETTENGTRRMAHKSNDKPPWACPGFSQQAPRELLQMISAGARVRYPQQAQHNRTPNHTCLDDNMYAFAAIMPSIIQARD